MKKEKIEKTVRLLLERLVQNDFEFVYDNDYTKKLSIEDVRDEVLAYPGILTMPPIDKLKDLDLYDTNFENQVWVDISLWFGNEESDLTLSCLIYDVSGKYHYSLEDIHVL
jgi:hypothetical protein